MRLFICVSFLMLLPAFAALADGPPSPPPPPPPCPDDARHACKKSCDEDNEEVESPLKCEPGYVCCILPSPPPGQ